MVATDYASCDYNLNTDNEAFSCSSNDVISNNDNN